MFDLRSLGLRKAKGTWWLHAWKDGNMSVLGPVGAVPTMPGLAAAWAWAERERGCKETERVGVFLRLPDGGVFQQGPSWHDFLASLLQQ